MLDIPAVRNRDAAIIDFVGTVIVWGIITVSRLLRYDSLDIKVLFIAAFWNRNNTVTNNKTQNNNTKLGVDRLSAPILSILPIIDIGHFKNRFGEKKFFNANKHTIYRWHYLLVNK